MCEIVIKNLNGLRRNNHLGLYKHSDVQYINLHNNEN